MLTTTNFSGTKIAWYANILKFWILTLKPKPDELELKFCLRQDWLLRLHPSTSQVIIIFTKFAFLYIALISFAWGEIWETFQASRYDLPVNAILSKIRVGGNSRSSRFNYIVKDILWLQNKMVRKKRVNEQVNKAKPSRKTISFISFHRQDNQISKLKQFFM
jgi:hypothetical protein